MKTNEVVVEDFSIISSDYSIYLKKSKVFSKGGHLIEDYFIFLKSIIIYSDKIDFLLVDKAYIINPHYRLVVNDLYIFLAKVDIDGWEKENKTTLDYKDKFNLIKKIEYFFNFGLLW